MRQLLLCGLRHRADDSDADESNAVPTAGVVCARACVCVRARLPTPIPLLRGAPTDRPRSLPFSPQHIVADDSDANESDAVPTAGVACVVCERALVCLSLLNASFAAARGPEPCSPTRIGWRIGSAHSF